MKNNTGSSTFTVGEAPPKKQSPNTKKEKPRSSFMCVRFFNSWTIAAMTAYWMGTALTLEPWQDLATAPLFLAACGLAGWIARD